MMIPEVFLIFFIIIGTIVTVLIASGYMARRGYIKEVLEIINDHTDINIVQMTEEETWPQPPGDCIDTKRLTRALHKSHSEGNWVEPMSDIYRFALHGERNVLFFRMKAEEGQLLPKTVSLNGTNVRINDEIKDILTEVGNEYFVLWKLGN